MADHDHDDVMSLREGAAIWVCLILLAVGFLFLAFRPGHTTPPLVVPIVTAPIFVPSSTVVPATATVERATPTATIGPVCGGEISGCISTPQPQPPAAGDGGLLR